MKKMQSDIEPESGRPTSTAPLPAGANDLKARCDYALSCHSHAQSIIQLMDQKVGIVLAMHSITLPVAAAVFAVVVELSEKKLTPCTALGTVCFVVLVVVLGVDVFRLASVFFPRMAESSPSGTPPDDQGKNSTLYFRYIAEKDVGTGTELSDEFKAMTFERQLRHTVSQYRELARIADQKIGLFGSRWLVIVPMVLLAAECSLALIAYAFAPVGQ